MQSARTSLETCRSLGFALLAAGCRAKPLVHPGPEELHFKTTFKYNSLFLVAKL